jgi:hypothetical protein
MVPANSCKIPRVPHYSGVRIPTSNFRVRVYHALWSAFPHTSANLWLASYLIPRPHLSKPRWFRLFRVRSPLLTESLLFSFPSGTEMVHFPELTLSALCIQAVVYRVPPFGNRRVSGYVLLTVAYRSFSRPSSSLSAKAFTACP